MKVPLFQVLVAACFLGSGLLYLPSSDLNKGIKPASGHSVFYDPPYRQSDNQTNITERSPDIVSVRDSSGFVRIIVQECCRTDLIPLQVRLFDKFLSEKYELYIVDGSTAQNATSQGLELIMKTHPSVRYFRCSALNLHGCYTESYRKLVASFRGLVMLANSDMFLWRQFSVRSYLLSWKACFAGVVETHGKVGEYIHAGLQILDTSCIPEDFAETVSWSIEPGGDVGSMTRHYLGKHPEFRMHPMTWSRNLDLTTIFHLRLIPAEIHEMLMQEAASKWEIRSDLYLENFAILHPRAGSGWADNGAGSGIFKAKMQILVPFLELRLKDAPLTWSSMSASTTKPVKVLQQHMQDWMPYFLDGTERERKAKTIMSHTSSTIKIGSDFNWSKRAVHEGLEMQSSGAKSRQSIESTSKTIISHKSSTIKTGLDSNWSKRAVHKGLEVQSSAAKSRQSIESTYDEWMKLLYQRADTYKEQVLLAENSFRKSGKKPLPPAAPPRTNLGLLPHNYDHALFAQSHVYFWKYVFNGTNNLPSSRNCSKRLGQRYWAVTYASGPERTAWGNQCKQACLANGFDEFILYTPDDIDTEYRKRNSEILGQKLGVGLWSWKHLMQWKTLFKMQDNDLLFYLDSDFTCSSETLTYMCLAQYQDVVPFHHSNSWYSLSRLASRDAMILMDLDKREFASSVQFSGGNIMFRKTPTTVDYLLYITAWSQQIQVAGGRGVPSRLGEDYQEYIASNFLHQCDQAISSLAIIKFGFKSYPWLQRGFGAGSDDVQNREQRKEAGLPLVEMVVDLHG